MTTLIIPSVIKTVPVTIDPICGKKIKTADRMALAAAFEASGNADAVIALVQSWMDTRGVYCNRYERMDDAIVQEDGKKITVHRVTETVPELRITVENAKQAMGILRERTGDAVTMTQASKHEAPLLARFTNMRYHQLGRLVDGQE